MPSGRFNGAARFCVRKYWARRWSAVVDLPASMGPHVFACGNLKPGKSAARRHGSFNGAARFCVRKSEAGKIGGETTRGLQGGRTFLRAEIACSSGTPLVELKLQWGRTFLRAEI